MLVFKPFTILILINVHPPMSVHWVFYGLRFQFPVVNSLLAFNMYYRLHSVGTHQLASSTLFSKEVTYLLKIMPNCAVQYLEYSDYYLMNFYVGIVYSSLKWVND